MHGGGEDSLAGLGKLIGGQECFLETRERPACCTTCWAPEAAFAMQWSSGARKMVGQRSRVVYRHVITMKRLVYALFRVSTGGLHDALWGA